jgi:hypothetical protein
MAIFLCPAIVGSANGVAGLATGAETSYSSPNFSEKL